MNTQKFLWAIVVLLLSALACRLGGSTSEKAASVVAEIPTGAPAETTEPIIEDIEEVAKEPTAVPEPVGELKVPNSLTSIRLTASCWKVLNCPLNEKSNAGSLRL